MTSSIFEFPNPVNEHSARLVALGVVVLTSAILLLNAPWLIAPLAYGFVARVFTGPTMSPLGQFVTRVATPRLGRTPKLVPGPPKRFAQGIGATLSVSATVLHFGFGQTGAAYILVAGIALAASLEAFVGFCAGCWIFANLMAWGLISEEICDSCANIPQRQTLSRLSVERAPNASDVLGYPERAKAFHHSPNYGRAYDDSIGFYSRR